MENNEKKGFPLKIRVFLYIWLIIWGILDYYVNGDIVVIYIHTLSAFVIAIVIESILFIRRKKS